MKAVILSAGFGTRLAPYTEKLAKPAIPFLTLPMAAFSHYYLKTAGVEKFFINTHHLPETVKSAYRKLDSEDHLEFSFENPILGSSGALLAFKSQLNKDFFLLNGDNVFIFDKSNFLKSIYKKHQQSSAMATLLVMPHPEAGQSLSACWVDDEGFILHIGPSCALKGVKPFHFFGIQILNPRVLALLPDGESHIFSDILKPLFQQKKVKAEIVEDLFWHETGNIEDYFKTTQLLIDEIVSESPQGTELINILKFYNKNLFFQKNPLILSADGPMGLDSLKVVHFFICGHGSRLNSGATVDSVVLGDNVQFATDQPLKEQLIL